MNLRTGRAGLHWKQVWYDHFDEDSSPRAPLPFLGLACAVGVSTMYYNQPLLMEMGRTYGATAGRTGFVAVATQVGYALGLLGSSRWEMCWNAVP